YLTIILKVIAVAMRLFGAALQAVARFLKPVWDYIRAVGNVLKAGLDWVIAWGAKLGDWPKVFAEARDWIVELLGWIAKLVTNPVATIKVLWDVAALQLPSFAPRVIEIGWKLAEFTVPGLKGAEVLVKLVLTGVEEAQRELENLHGQEIGMRVVTEWQKAKDAIDEAVRYFEGVLFPHGAENPSYVPVISADTSPGTQALVQMGTDLAKLLSPDTPYTVSIFGDNTAIIKVIDDVLSAISEIPVKVKVGFALLFDGVTNAINSLISMLNSIPRYIETVVNQVRGTAAVPDTTGATATAGELANVDNPGGMTVGERVSLGVIATGGAGAAIGIGRSLAGMGGIGCFTADTRVWTANGLIRISEIVVGDSVEVYDPDTATVVNAPVCETLVHHDHPVWTLRIHGDVVSTTAEHPFLTTDGWKRADELVPGSVVITAVGREIVEESCASGTTATVYNLHVDHPAHTYLVGTARWVVHNYKTSGAFMGLGASGAIVTQPTMALIGEKGPEALVPLDQMPGASPLGSFGGGIDTVIINVSGFADGASAGRAAADA
ncbi:hypothetical protein EBR44_13370, partial [bacterium]|nr:hypothetical protein [bacterium]